MIHAARIDRLVRAERFEQLLDEVLANGRALPMQARAMLTQPGADRLAAMGLALQRVVELSYLPTPSTINLAQRLLSELAPMGLAGGSGGTGGTADSMAAAVNEADSGARTAATRADACGHRIAGLIALVGLEDVVHQAQSCGVELPPGMEAGVARVRERIAYGLFEAAAITACREPARRGLVGSDLESAMTVWQLAPRPALAAAIAHAVDLPVVQRAIQRHGVWKNRDCSQVLALAGEVVTPGAAHQRSAA